MEENVDVARMGCIRGGNRGYASPAPGALALVAISDEYFPWRADSLCGIPRNPRHIVETRCFDVAR